MKTIIIHNLQQVEEVYCGQVIAVDGYYQLQDQAEIDKFAGDAKVNQHLWSNPPKIEIGNGSEFLSQIDGDKWLKDNLVKLEGVNVCCTERALKTTPTKLEGSSSLLVSHNFCDKTTWWQKSIRVIEEVLSPDQAYLIYTSTNSYWIDLVSGKVPYEDRYASNYRAIVYVDNIEITTGFVINYQNGSIIFNQSQAGKVIKATYSYENSSTWTSGKILKLLGTEVKFTSDASLDSGLDFVVTINNYQVSKVTYKNLENLLICSRGKIGRITGFGTLTTDLISIDYDYVTSKELRYSQAAAIEISIVDHQPLPGTLGFVTAYIISIDE
jgi:hypothetical protein